MKGKEKREREDGGAGNVKVDERKKKMSLARSLALLSKSLFQAKKNQNDAAAQDFVKRQHRLPTPRTVPFPA
jgi:hypothetical protein